MENIVSKLDPRMQEFARNFLHVTTHDKKHKMAGIQSISTSVLENPICQSRRKCPGSVCAKCYASHLIAYRKPLAACLSRNLALLTDHLFDEREALRVPIETLYARVESFGDVANVTQARNYIRIIRANPETRWGIWSKNDGIWRAAFHREGKPENCTYVHSSMGVNKPENVVDDFVDHVFTVWDKAHYTFAGTPSECAGLSCRKCLKCYTKGGQFYINELLR